MITSHFIFRFYTHFITSSFISILIVKSGQEVNSCNNKFRSFLKSREIKTIILFLGGFEGITSTSFSLQTSDGTAVDGSDYTGGTFPLTINFVGIGGTTSQNISITDDGVSYSISKQHIDQQLKICFLSEEGTVGKSVKHFIESITLEMSARSATSTDNFLMRSGAHSSWNCLTVLISFSHRLLRHQRILLLLWWQLNLQLFHQLLLL